MFEFHQNSIKMFEFHKNFRKISSKLSTVRLHRTAYDSKFQMELNIKFKGGDQNGKLSLIQLLKNRRTSHTQMNKQKAHNSHIHTHTHTHTHWLAGHQEKKRQQYQNASQIKVELVKKEPCARTWSQVRHGGRTAMNKRVRSPVSGPPLFLKRTPAPSIGRSPCQAPPTGRRRWPAGQPLRRRPLKQRIKLPPFTTMQLLSL